MSETSNRNASLLAQLRQMYEWQKRDLADVEYGIDKATERLRVLADKKAEIERGMAETRREINRLMGGDD